jgi:hypothetical protein
MSSTSVGDNMVTAQDVDALVQMARDWVQALKDGRFDWMEKHLAPDFRFTSYLIAGPPLGKAKFIEIVSNVKKANVDFISIAAEGAGKIIVARFVLYVEEEFVGELGPGLPSAQELTERIWGRRIAYSSGYRRSGDGWQCFDHHQIGPVD